MDGGAVWGGEGGERRGGIGGGAVNGGAVLGGGGAVNGGAVSGGRLYEHKNSAYLGPELRLVSLVRFRAILSFRAPKL